jgi:hypothetical protein
MTLLAAIVIAAPVASGQTADADVDEVQYPLGRFSVGGRVQILFNNLMNSETLTSSTADPVVETRLATSSTSSHLSGGATVEFAVTQRIAIGADILYRNVGYKAGVDIIEGVDDEDTEDEDERLYTTKFEGTEATFWDVPVYVRFYDAPRREKKVRVFLEVGGAVRRMTNLSTFREVINSDETSSVDETPVTPIHRTLPGVLIGGGFQIPGNAGIKITPSLRYTRWLGDTFNESPTRSNRNQFEFVFGVTF